MTSYWIMACLWLTLLVLFLGLLAWGLWIRAFRKGFRAAIDFMDGRRPLPSEITTWRGALHSQQTEPNT